MKTYTSTLLLLAYVKVACRHSAKNENQEVSSISFEFSAISAKISKGMKSLKEPIRCFLDASCNSGSGKAGKSSGDPSSDKASRRFLDVSGSEDFIESMYLDFIESMSLDFIVSASVSGKSYKTRTNAKSSKESSSDEEEARSGDEEEASSSDEDQASVETKGKSSKGKPFKANILRSIDPSSSQANGPPKSQSYIEYTRAQAPESVAEPSDESSGVVAFGLVASLFAIALPLVTASVVFV